MARKPTIPRRENIALDALPAGARRNQTVVTFQETTASDSLMLMRGNASVPQVTYVGINTGNIQYHVAAEEGTWIFSLINSTSGLTLNAVAASLSNQTLGATAFKSIPVNNGNSTIGNGEGLRAVLTTSGTAVTMDEVVFVIDWLPTAVA